MGVKGLWKILKPCCTSVTFADLQHMRVAVDLNLWLNEIIKGMTDDNGKVLPGAHLIGLLNRICTLIFHNITPVLVLDGPSPIGKRSTVQQRQIQRKKALSTYENIAMQIVRQQLRHRGLRHLLDKSAKQKQPKQQPTTEPSTSSQRTQSRSRKQSQTIQDSDASLDSCSEVEMLQVNQDDDSDLFDSDTSASQPDKPPSVSTQGADSPSKRKRPGLANSRVVAPQTTLVVPALPRRAVRRVNHKIRPINSLITVMPGQSPLVPSTENDQTEKQGILRELVHQQGKIRRKKKVVQQQADEELSEEAMNIVTNLIQKIRQQHQNADQQEDVPISENASEVSKLPVTKSNSVIPPTDYELSLRRSGPPLSSSIAKNPLEQQLEPFPDSLIDSKVHHAAKLLLQRLINTVDPAGYAVGEPGASKSVPIELDTPLSQGGDGEGDVVVVHDQQFGWDRVVNALQFQQGVAGSELPQLYREAYESLIHKMVPVEAQRRDGDDDDDDDNDNIGKDNRHGLNSITKSSSKFKPAAMTASQLVISSSSDDGDDDDDDDDNKTTSSQQSKKHVKYDFDEDLLAVYRDQSEQLDTIPTSTSSSTTVSRTPSTSTSAVGLHSVHTEPTKEELFAKHDELTHQLTAKARSQVLTVEELAQLPISAQYEVFEYQRDLIKRQIHQDVVEALQSAKPSVLSQTTFAKFLTQAEKRKNVSQLREKLVIERIDQLAVLEQQELAAESGNQALSNGTDFQQLLRHGQSAATAAAAAASSNASSSSAIKSNTFGALPLIEPPSYPNKKTKYNDNSGGQSRRDGMVGAGLGLFALPATTQRKNPNQRKKLTLSERIHNIYTARAAVSTTMDENNIVEDASNNHQNETNDQSKDDLEQARLLDRFAPTPFSADSTHAEQQLLSHRLAESALNSRLEDLKAQSAASFLVPQSTTTTMQSPHEQQQDPPRSITPFRAKNAFFADDDDDDDDNNDDGPKAVAETKHTSISHSIQHAATRIVLPEHVVPDIAFDPNSTLGAVSQYINTKSQQRLTHHHNNDEIVVKPDPDGVVDEMANVRDAFDEYMKDDLSSFLRNIDQSMQTAFGQSHLFAQDDLQGANLPAHLGEHNDSDNANGQGGYNDDQDDDDDNDNGHSEADLALFAALQQKQQEQQAIAAKFALQSYQIDDTGKNLPSSSNEPTFDQTSTNQHHTTGEFKIEENADDGDDNDDDDDDFDLEFEDTIDTDDIKPEAGQQSVLNMYIDVKDAQRVDPNQFSNTAINIVSAVHSSSHDGNASILYAPQSFQQQEQISRRLSPFKEDQYSQTRSTSQLTTITSLSQVSTSQAPIPPTPQFIDTTAITSQSLGDNRFGLQSVPPSWFTDTSSNNTSTQPTSDLPPFTANSQKPILALPGNISTASSTIRLDQYVNSRVASGLTPQHLHKLNFDSFYSAAAVGGGGSTSSVPSVDAADMQPNAFVQDDQDDTFGVLQRPVQQLNAAAGGSNRPNSMTAQFLLPLNASQQHKQQQQEPLTLGSDGLPINVDFQPAIPRAITTNFQLESALHEYNQTELKVLHELLASANIQSLALSQSVIIAAILLAKLLGIEVVMGEGEADTTMALLHKKKYVHAVMTNDNDLVVRGCDVVRHAFKKDKPMTLCRAIQVRNVLGLHSHHLLELAVILGNDYSPGVHNVGPVQALELVAKYPSMSALTTYVEKVRSNPPHRWVFPAGFPSAVPIRMFTTDQDTIIFAQPPNIEVNVYAVCELLYKQAGWDINKTKQMLERSFEHVFKNPDSQKQFFQSQLALVPQITSLYESKRMRLAIMLLRGVDPTFNQQLDLATNDDADESVRSSSIRDSSSSDSD